MYTDWTVLSNKDLVFVYWFGDRLEAEEVEEIEKEFERRGIDENYKEND